MKKLEEPVSPAGRLFNEPNFNVHILSIMGCKTKINLDSAKQKLPHTLLKHPRFSSLLVSLYTHTCINIYIYTNYDYLVLCCCDLLIWLARSTYIYMLFLDLNFFIFDEFSWVWLESSNYCFNHVDKRQNLIWEKRWSWDEVKRGYYLTMGLQIRCQRCMFLSFSNHMKLYLGIKSFPLSSSSLNNIILVLLQLDSSFLEHFGSVGLKKWLFISSLLEFASAWASFHI